TQRNESGFAANQRDRGLSEERRGQTLPVRGSDSQSGGSGRAGRPHRQGKRGDPSGGRAAAFRLRAQSALGSMPRTRNPGHGTRGQGDGVPILLSRRGRRPAGTRARTVHARYPHKGKRLQRDLAASDGKPSVAVRDDATSQV